MKSKLLLITALSTFAFSLSACPKPSDTTLSYQYETGALQWQIARKEIDPNTLIHQAILENAPEVINFLLSHGVKVDYPNENGMSPLTIAILNGSTDAARLLLANGANSNPPVKWNNMTLLELAFYMKDCKSAKELINHGADVNSNDSLLLLTRAIANETSSPDSIELACELIKRSAYILPEAIFYAIHSAMKKRDRSVLEVMIEKGVDFNVKDDPKTGYIFPVILVLRNWNPRDPNQDAEVFKLLVKAGANLNSTVHGHTALTDGICSNDLDKIQFLVELGADVNKTIFFEGKVVSPLVLALQRAQPEIVQYLLQHGARG